MLIDCDVHVSPWGLQGLQPYMDAATRELVENSGGGGLELPTYPWYHPTGWVRKDVWDPLNPDFSDSSIEKVRQFVLDPNDVTFGIADPDGVAGALCVLPN